jgi:hypothetical protein
MGERVAQFSLGARLMREAWVPGSQVAPWMQQDEGMEYRGVAVQVDSVRTYLEAPMVSALERTT